MKSPQTTEHDGSQFEASGASSAELEHEVFGPGPSTRPTSEPTFLQVYLSATDIKKEMIARQKKEMIQLLRRHHRERQNVEYRENERLESAAHRLRGDL